MAMVEDLGSAVASATSVLGKIIESFRAIAGDFSELDKLMLTQVDIPFTLPAISVKAINRFENLFYEKVEKNSEMTDVAVYFLGRNLELITAIPRLKVDTYYISVDGESLTVFVLKVVNTKELMNDVIIPLACVNRECRIRLPLIEILKMTVFLTKNEEYVKGLFKIITSISKTIQSTTDKMMTLLNVLKLAGFEN